MNWESPKTENLFYALNHVRFKPAHDSRFRKRFFLFNVITNWSVSFQVSTKSENKSQVGSSSGPHLGMREKERSCFISQDIDISPLVILHNQRVRARRKVENKPLRGTLIFQIIGHAHGN